MPIKKIFKIAGLILLAFIIVFFGLIIALGGFVKNASQVASSQLAIRTMNFSGAGVPSSGSVGMSSPEIAKDSGAVTKQDSAPGITAAVDKKIIKTGNLNLKVGKADTAADSIANIAKLHQGEVSNSNFYESSRGIKSGSITVRVPYQAFDAAFSEIKKIAAQVISEASNAQDITEQYIDLEARLKNTQAEETSFVALLNRSGKIEEILSVTREVARVRGEIEQLQGQLRYLNSQTDMSSITVNLSEDEEIASVSQDWRPWQTFKTSVRLLIINGQNFVDGLISFIIVVLPALLIYALIIWLIYFIGKKIYRRYF